MSADISVRLTAAVRAADSRFESVGGSSRHYVNDCLLPALEAGRLVVVDAYVSIHRESAERDVSSLATKLDAADHRVAALEQERILLGACLTKAEKQRDELLSACERVTDLLNDPGVGDVEQWKRDCREWSSRARAAIAKIKAARS